MLPSMPILFTRESQDAFGNKIVPSTSFFSQNSASKADIKPEPPPKKNDPGPSTALQNETNNIVDGKKKEPAKATPEKTQEYALDAALVRSYYSRVQSRFSANQTVPTNKFVQFQSILKSFDPAKETPVDLYRKIEQLFGVEHYDIVEDFLLFLKPGQAAQVGRFSDHFMLTKMTKFIELLQPFQCQYGSMPTMDIFIKCTLSRKPTVLRKVLRAVSTGLASGGADEMKARVLPHLRSNPKLAQMFKALFPDERPPDSLYETGVDMLNETFLTDDKGYDVWAFPEDKYDNRKPEDSKCLDTVYLHGRVFLQHGRLLRPACVTYPYSKEPYRVNETLAPHSRLSPPPADETSSPKRKNSKITQRKPKKTPKSPMKNIKDVNDNTKHKETVTITSPKATKGKQNGKTKYKKDEKTEAPKKKALDRTMERKDDAPKPKLARIEVTATEIKKETKSNWTREEDKTMLQVLKGEAGSEEVFGRIQESLPHRSFTEIKERFCHVMSLLKEMAVGKVT